MALSSTQAQGLLKKAYDPKVPEQQVFSRFPFFTMVKKRTGAGGESWTVPCIYAANVRAGTNFTSASAVTETAPAAKFELPYGNLYGVSSVDGKVFAQTGDAKKQAEAFMPIIIERAKSTTKTVSKLAALYLSRSSTGSIGQIATTTTVASTTIVLTNPSDQYNFEEGMQIQLVATDGGTLRSAGATALISTIPGDGTLILSAVLTSTIAAAATGDFIVNVGDNNHGIAGLASWAPLATSKGTFAGVNRDLSPRKLAGLYVDASALSLTVDAGVSRALNTMKANEGNCTHVFMNPIDYEALCQTGSTQVVAEAGEEREFGFKAVSFVSDGSKARVIEDATFPAGQAWLVNMANIEYVYAGSEIDYLDQDGQTWLRVGGSDSYEMRIGAYPAGLAVKNPGRSLCVVKLY